VSRETLGATALGLVSFSWLVSAYVFYTSPPDAASSTLGLLSLAVVLLGSVGILGKPLLAAVILLAVGRFSTSGLYELPTIGAADILSGVLGFLIFGVSLYGASPSDGKPSSIARSYPLAAAARPAKPSRATSANSSAR
jgi:hypothetical protein